MSTGGTAKKLAAVTGGGISLVGGAVGLIMAEAQLARRQIGNADGEPPAPSGWYGHGRPGPAGRLNAANPANPTNQDQLVGRRSPAVDPG